MIKLLKKYEIHTTPFEAVKNWAINNTDNENVLLYESTGSDDGLPYALEYVNYGVSYPTLNSSCDISLEQQDADLATLELGLNVVGIFYPEADPKNIDGTYMRSIYHQVRTMFYNQYFDPTKIWGSENIDFPLSKTERRMSDEIRLIDIPRLVFGDKIVPKSVTATDNTTDNEYIITDDGYGNLRAGINLFSRQQEIRHHRNEFDVGYSEYCDPYFNFASPTPINLSASLIPYHTAHLTWETSSSPITEDGFILQGRNVTLSAPYSTVAIVGTGVLTYDYWPLYSQHTYAFRVESFVGIAKSNWSNEAYITAPADPVIILQPQDQTNIEELTASFSSSAGITAPYFYQWISGSTLLVDYSRITGSLTPELLINDLQFSDAGPYALYVTNSWGNVYSNAAYLTVISNIIPVYVNDSASVSNNVLLFGSITNGPPFTEGTIPITTTELLTGDVLTLVVTMSALPDTASVNAGFFAGNIFDTVLTLYGGNETASVSSGFYDGAIFDVIIPIYGGNETASVSSGFDSGYITLVVTESFGDDTFTDITTTLISGSVSGSSP